MFESKSASWSVKYINSFWKSKAETKKEIDEVFKDLLILLWIKDWI